MLNQFVKICIFLFVERYGGGGAVWSGLGHVNPKSRCLLADEFCNSFYDRLCDFASIYYDYNYRTIRVYKDGNHICDGKRFLTVLLFLQKTIR